MIIFKEWRLNFIITKPDRIFNFQNLWQILSGLLNQTRMEKEKANFSFQARVMPRA
jgi:hypothetical protein